MKHKQVKHKYTKKHHEQKEPITSRLTFRWSSFSAFTVSPCVSIKGSSDVELVEGY